MAYKETFADSLKMIPDALKWAERQDIKQLRDFFIVTLGITRDRFCFNIQIKKKKNRTY